MGQSKKAAVFPWLLSRIAGESYEIIDELNSGSQELQSLYIARENALYTLQRKKTSLLESLYQCIGQCSNVTDGDILKQLRREIFKGKFFTETACNDLAKTVPDLIFQELKDYFKDVAAYNIIEPQFDMLYKESILTVRKSLQHNVAKSSALKNGLVLSSKDLLFQIDKYISQPAANFVKGDLQTEMGLLKFVTRICCKTSPFSTFTNVSLSTISDKESVPIKERSSTGSPSVKSSVKLNNILLRYLKSLLTSYEKCYEHFKLSLNPSITFKENRWTFLVNHHNTEVFQYLEYTELTAHLISYLNKRKTYTTFKKIVSLIKDVTGSSEIDARNYIKSLIDTGFLEFEFEVSGLDPNWDKALIKKLKLLQKYNIPGLNELLQTLRVLSKLTLQYRNTESTDRLKILDEAFVLFRNTCKSLHILAGLPQSELLSFEKGNAEGQQKLSSQGGDPTENKMDGILNGFRKREKTDFIFRPEQIFYEDTVTSGAFDFGYDQLNDVVQNLAGLLQSLKNFGILKREKKEMAAYFEEKYGIGKRTSLLNFYEDFYKDVKSREESGQNENVPTSRKKEDTAENRLWKAKFKELIIPKIDSHSVDLESEDIIALSDFKNEIYPYSAGSFVQPWIDKKSKKLCFVVNNSFPGYGKMISRFLYLFPETFENDLRAWNKKFSETEALQCECTDASFFNANMHPPLMPFETKVPGGNNSISKEALINCADLEVELDKNAEELYLKHSASREIVRVYNLGFQNSDTRSKLFQLFERFSKQDYVYAAPVVLAVNSKVSQSLVQDLDLIIFPRITMDKNIVLQRKTWQIGHKHLPLQDKQSDSQYYLKVNEWRKLLNIPDEVFISSQKTSGKVPNNSDHKPQYINFYNPLLVRLFGKMVKRDLKHIRVMEMLPSSEDMLRLNGERYATEFVLQWYHNAK